MRVNDLNLHRHRPHRDERVSGEVLRPAPGGGNQGMQMLRDDGGMVLTLIKARAEDRDRGQRSGIRDQGAGIRGQRAATSPRACGTEQLSHWLHPAEQGARGRD